MKSSLQLRPWICWVLIVTLSSPIVYSAPAHQGQGDFPSPPLARLNTSVVVQGRTADYAEVSAFIESNNSRVSLIKYLESRVVSSLESKHLLEDFEAAQQELERGNCSEAGKQFHQIFSRRHDEDWSDQFRLLMFEAGLKTTWCMAATPERESLLRLAHIFAPDLKVDSERYSKDLQRAFWRAQQSVKYTHIDLVSLKSKYLLLIRNGQRISLRGKKSIRVPIGAAREHWLSLQLAPLQRVVQEPEPIPEPLESDRLVEGDCEDPGLFHEIVEGLPNPIVFFNSECSWSIIDSRWKRDPSRQTRVGLPPLFLPSSALAPELRLSESAPASDTVFKNPWFWIAVAAIGAGAFAVWRQNQMVNGPMSSSPGPSAPREPTVIPAP